MKLFDVMLELGYALRGGRLYEDEGTYMFRFEAIDGDEITDAVINYLYAEERKGHISSFVMDFDEYHYDSQGNRKGWSIAVYVEAAA